MIADVSRPVDSARVIETGPFRYLYPVVHVGNGRIIFRSSDRNGRRFVLYDVATSSTRTLDLKGCIPQLWREKTRQLICYDEKSGRYFFTDLDGEIRTPLNWTEGTVPGFYIDKNDSIVVCIERGHRHEGAIFSLSGAPRYTLLADDLIFGLGGAVWIEGN
jgi:hypothetical protein